MKTKILKTFLISVLVAGTFGTAFAQQGPGSFDNKEACEEAGFFWSLNSQGNGGLQCRKEDYIGPSGS